MVTTAHAVLHVIAHHHSYLYATRLSLWEGMAFSVYRSPLLSVAEDAYKPVRDVLEKHSHEMVWQETVIDKSMMFGEAEHTVFRIKENNWLK